MISKAWKHETETPKKSLRKNKHGQIIFREGFRLYFEKFGHVFRANSCQFDAAKYCSG